ncbi:MAG: sigma-54 dependent transcriptional regulator [Bryobacteraceae bacterium]
MPTVLALGRDESTLQRAGRALSQPGIDYISATDADEAGDLLGPETVDIVVLDAALPGAREIPALIRERNPAARIILLTDASNGQTGVEGVSVCFPKARIEEDLFERVLELLRYPHADREPTATGPPDQVDRFCGMVGRSPQMREVFSRIQQVAPHYRVALVCGATGTGKELAARALHALSPAAHKRLVVCNCPAIVETLFESELFGHVRGAFTGATQDRVGLFEYARGGTVFLDEISEIPLSTQSKLLRVVQHQELQRVGSPEIRKTDARVIAATNRDMRALIREHLFREDLYYRLSMVELTLPRLSERRPDIPLLERHYLSQFETLYGKRLCGISRRAQNVLVRHTWPGNVRELENVLGHAAMMADSEYIDLRHLPQYLQHGAVSRRPEDEDLLPLAEIERRYVRQVLKRVSGNKLQAAQILQISRATLYRILRGSSDTTGNPRRPWEHQPADLRIQ